MTVQNQNQQGETRAEDARGETPGASPAKKPFVEPAISHPVDVLEATTYFQVVDSGGSGLRKKEPSR
jgi:hypothetical protein